MSKSQTTTENIPNIHPGEILSEEFLKPMNITPYRLAKELGIPQTRISEILHEKRGITADTAIRLSCFFGTSAEFWMNLQSLYDLEETKRSKAEEFSQINRYAFA